MEQSQSNLREEGARHIEDIALTQTTDTGAQIDATNITNIVVIEGDMGIDEINLDSVR